MKRVRSFISLNGKLKIEMTSVNLLTHSLQESNTQITLRKSKQGIFFTYQFLKTIMK